MCTQTLWRQHVKRFDEQLRLYAEKGAHRYVVAGGRVVYAVAGQPIDDDSISLFGIEIDPR